MVLQSPNSWNDALLLGARDFYQGSQVTRLGSSTGRSCSANGELRNQRIHVLNSYHHYSEAFMFDKRLYSHSPFHKRDSCKTVIISWMLSKYLLRYIFEPWFNEGLRAYRLTPCHTVPVSMLAYSCSSQPAARLTSLMQA